MEAAPIPTVLALLLCDQVITEAQTNKKSLIGVFQNLNAFSFPTVMRLGIYAKMADAQGNYDFLIRMVHLKNEEVLTEFELAGAEVKDRRKPLELGINLAGILIPEPGRYEFQLYANGAYLGRITLEARLLQARVQGGA